MRDGDRARLGITTATDALQAASPRGLPGALAAHAARAPEEPFLFYPDGFYVRWRSHATVAAQVAGGAAALGARGIPAGARVAFTWSCEPDAVAADLAIQAAGLVAVPGSGDAPGARLLMPGEEGDEGLARLPAADAAVGRAESEPPAPAPPGGAVVAAAGAPAGSGAELGAADLLAGAAGLTARLATAVTPAPRREIALAHFDLAAPDGRAFAAWALVAGAALFLEPDPRALPGAAAWARPSVVASSFPALRELERLAREGEARRRRARPPGSHPPFGRLRALVLLGPGRISADQLGFWLERRVAVVRAG